LILKVIMLGAFIIEQVTLWKDQVADSERDEAVREYGKHTLRLREYYQIVPALPFIAAIPSSISSDATDYLDNVQLGHERRPKVIRCLSIR